MDNYDGPGSGPGLSVLTCAEALGYDEPFALAAADGIVHTMPPLAGETWMGASLVDDPTSYLTLETDADGDVRGLQERTGPSRLAYNGVAWIADPATYFAGLRRGVDSGELQVTQGFQALLDAGVRVRSEPCDWTDAGTTETYAAARRRVRRVRHRGPRRDRRHLPAARPRGEVVPRPRGRQPPRRPRRRADRRDPADRGVTLGLAGL